MLSLKILPALSFNALNVPILRVVSTIFFNYSFPWISSMSCIMGQACGTRLYRFLIFALFLTSNVDSYYIFGGRYSYSTQRLHWGQRFWMASMSINIIQCGIWCLRVYLRCPPPQADIYTILKSNILLLYFYIYTHWHLIKMSNWQSFHTIGTTSVKNTRGVCFMSGKTYSLYILSRLPLISMP